MSAKSTILHTYLNKILPITVSIANYFRTKNIGIWKILTAM